MTTDTIKTGAIITTTEDAHARLVADETREALDHLAELDVLVIGLPAVLTLAEKLAGAEPGATFTAEDGDALSISLAVGALAGGEPVGLDQGPNLDLEIIRPEHVGLG